MRYPLLVLLVLAACGKELALPEAPAAPVDPSTTVVEATPSPTPAPSDPVVSLSVYSLTGAVAASGGVTLSGTGSCAVYLTRTFCWDDGTKVFAGDTRGYQYFGIEAGPASCPNFFGACDDDPFSTPTEPSSDTISKMPANRRPFGVLSSGAETVVDCTEHGGVLTCPTFMIDTTRGAL